jgi:hypothetical protein
MWLEPRYINLDRNQFGRKSGEPLELPLGISVFDHHVPALDPYPRSRSP